MGETLKSQLRKGLTNGPPWNACPFETGFHTTRQGLEIWKESLYVRGNRMQCPLLHLGGGVLFER